MTGNTCKSAKCAELRKENARLRAMLTERGVHVPTAEDARATGTERAHARYGDPRNNPNAHQRITYGRTL